MISKRLVAALTGMLLLAAPMAQAVTYSNISGVVHENLVPRDAPDAAPGQVLGDWGTNPARVVLGIVGETTIYGGLVHADTGRNRYLDAWTMDFGSDVYNVAFTWTGTPESRRYQRFDGSFTVNGARTDVGEAGTLFYTGLTGRVTFVFNPVHGTSTPRERARWILNATPVPLPAGAVLLLAGLAGLAGLRRRATH